MSKKRNKKIKNNTRLVRELSLIIPAFSYIWDRMSHVDHNSKEPDVVLALRISKRMAMITKRFTVPLQKQALEFNTKVQAKANHILNERMGVTPVNAETELNIFLLGLQLLAVHHEVKNKTIFIGHLSDVMELQEFAVEAIDPMMVSKTMDFADIVLEQTFKLSL